MFSWLCEFICCCHDKIPDKNILRQKSLFFFPSEFHGIKSIIARKAYSRSTLPSLPSCISSKKERVNRKQGQAKAQSQVLLIFASTSKEPSEVSIIFPSYHPGTKCSATSVYGEHFTFFRPQQCWIGFSSHSSCRDDIILLSIQWTKRPDLFIHGSILVLCFYILSNCSSLGKSILQLPSEYCRPHNARWCHFSIHFCILNW